MRNICVATGTRAEYGLLYWLLKEIESGDVLNLQLIVTGMHLSPEFGLTYKEIEKEFNIDKKVEMLLSSDTHISTSKSMALAQISFSECFEELKPDLLIVLGDRTEMLSVSIAAMLANIPIAHIHGGERTEGAIDESIRHSITKMSYLHFTASQEYKNRVIQLGENPNRVFNVGGLGIDNIKRLELLTKDEFEKSINFSLNEKNLLVTFHPVTLEANNSKEQFQEILNSLDKLDKTNIIFTKANSDTNGRIINQMIDEYVLERSNCIAFTSLGQLRYLSALQYVDAVVGNSSSGLLEAPSFKIATVNIGDRQKGRIEAKSVISCKCLKKDIIKAFDTLYSNEFQKNLLKYNNPYENENTVQQIIEVIKQTNFKNILKKEFYDYSL